MPSNVASNVDDKLDTVVSLLAQARQILCVTGAGISAESGIPTYRGIGGLYEDVTPDGIPIEEALSGDMMQLKPAVTWKYIHQIEAASRGASFNRAHAVLSAFEERFELRGVDSDAFRAVCRESLVRHLAIVT